MEGIETEVQYEALADMKIKYIQGYYFDMALSKDAFEEKYIAKKRKTAKTVQK